MRIRILWRGIHLLRRKFNQKGSEESKALNDDKSGFIDIFMFIYDLHKSLFEWVVYDSGLLVVYNVTKILPRTKKDNTRTTIKSCVTLRARMSIFFYSPSEMD